MHKPTCHKFHRLMHVETVHRAPLVSWLLPVSPRAVISVLWKPLPQASLSSWGYSTLAVGLLNSGQASPFNLCDLKTNSWQSFCSFWALICFQPHRVTPYTKVGGHLKLQITALLCQCHKNKCLCFSYTEGWSPGYHRYHGHRAELHPAGQIISVIMGNTEPNKQPSTLAENSVVYVWVAI